MAYDFKTIINRSKVGSEKWALMYKQNPQVDSKTVPLSVADMEFDNAPEIKEGLKTFIDNTVLGYTGQNEAFLKAVVDWQKKRYGWDIKPEWIVNTPGVVNAIYAGLGALTEKNDGVMIFKPVYYPFSNAINDLGRNEVNIPLKHDENYYYEIDFQAFEREAKKPENKVLLFCSPHNPVGRVWKEEELKRLADICVEHRVYIISDEIWSDFVFQDYQHTVFNKIDKKLDDLIITCNSPSKSFNLAGLAISNIIISNNDIKEKFQEELSRLRSSMVGIIGYEAVRLAYTKSEAWLDELLQVIHINQVLVYEFFKESYPKIKSRMPEGTYLHWLDFRELGMDNQELEDFLHHKAEFFTDEGYIFGEEGSGFERINVALPTKQLQYQLDKLLKALKERDESLNE